LWGRSWIALLSFPLEKRKRICYDTSRAEKTKTFFHNFLKNVCFQGAFSSFEQQKTAEKRLFFNGMY